MRGEGEGDGGVAVGLVLVTAVVVQVLVDANAELDELGTDAVKLRSSASNALDSLGDLGASVGASGGDTSVVQNVEKIDLALQFDGSGKIIVFIVNVSRCGARTVLVELVSPEALFVIALKIGPDRLQSRNQIRHVLRIELGTAEAGPSTIVVLRPKAMNHPILEILCTSVATTRGAHTSRPTNRSPQISS